MTDKRYWLIPADKAAPIIADHKAAGPALMVRLSELAGVPVTNADRRGNMAAGFAYIVNVYADTLPTQPGWKPDPAKPGTYVPNRRTVAGRALIETLDSLDALGVYSALKRGGVNPWWTAPMNSFKCAAAGIGIIGDQILLLTSAEHDYQWPEWVQEIKASEFYRIQEDAQAGPL